MNGTTDHIEHEFIHNGGGTLLATQESDDSYACACGAKMRVEKLTVEQHFAMPSTIRIPAMKQGAVA